MADGGPAKTSFDEISVKRINIVEPDGKYRLVLANSENIPIHPMRVMNEVANSLARDAILCVDGNETLEAKLMTGGTGYDVVFPSSSFFARQIKIGLFHKLDKSLLPNLKNMDPELMKRVALHDPDNAHSVNYL